MNDDANVRRMCKNIDSSYDAVYVSWNDNQRQQGSCYGSNITDARLKGKDGQNFLVIRPSNFDEKIGKVAAKDVALIVGHYRDDGQLQPETLKSVLQNFKTHAKYAAHEDSPFLQDDANSSLFDEARDNDAIGIRFQAVFLPNGEPNAVTGDQTIEFFPETYNYQTLSDSVPKNLVLLCTSQGTFVQQDHKGSQGQFLHKKIDGEWKDVYMEALKTNHKMSISQKESEEERKEALMKGKAVSTVIGTKAMGTGFNRLMTVQVPVKVIPNKLPRSSGPKSVQPQYFSLNTASNDGEEPEFMKYLRQCENAADIEEQDYIDGPCEFRSFEPCEFRSSGSSKIQVEKVKERGAPITSFATAARVSHGSVRGSIRKLAKDLKFQRDTSTAITITVQFYYTYDKSRGITQEDVKRAIEICNEAYSGCTWTGQLMDTSSTSQSDFAKKDMDVKDAILIAAKQILQPYKSSNDHIATQDHLNVFPMDTTADNDDHDVVEEQQKKKNKNNDESFWVSFFEHDEGWKCKTLEIPDARIKCKKGTSWKDVVKQFLEHSEDSAIEVKKMNLMSMYTELNLNSDATEANVAFRWFKPNQIVGEGIQGVGSQEGVIVVNDFSGVKQKDIEKAQKYVASQKGKTIHNIF